MDGNGGGGVLPFYHVPQQSRREKLRYPTNELLDLSPPPHFLQQHHHNPSLFLPPPPSSSTSLLNSNYSGGGGPVGTQFDSLFPHQGVSLSLASYNPMVATDARIPRVSSWAAAAAPSEPFTGYAAVLKSSRFLRPAQQMLEEICNVGGRPDDLAPSADLGLDGPGEQSGCGGDLACGSREHGRVKSRLISMMDEVYRRYKQYYQQVQYVITSFESVAGLSNATPYATFALKSMTKHFRGLKNAITEQLRFTEKASQSKEEMHGLGHIAGGGLCYQGVSHGSSNVGQPSVWRPQRGLPERAVAVLKAWLFEHFLHPYPTDTDKHLLAKQTGLSRNQVSNWFINARVRLWKPLVEEIHSLEMKQSRKLPDSESNDGGKQQHPQLPPAASSSDPNSKQPVQSLGLEKNHDPPPKRFRNEFVDEPPPPPPIGMAFDDFQTNQQHRLGAGVGGVPTSGNTGISLTLGLHQNNNGICIQEPLPLNVARRFGLEESSGASYVVGGYEVQDRHFGNDMDGQLLRDFVG